MCRAKTLRSLSGRKQTQDTPHYTCALDMPQVCDDARAGAVLNELTARRTTAPQTGHALHAHGQHARGRRHSAHARGQSRPRQRLAALRLRRGRVPVDMTKLLPVIFAVPVAACVAYYTKGRLSVIGDGRLHGWT